MTPRRPTRARVTRVVVAAALAAGVFAATASSSSSVIGGAVIQIQAAPWTVFVQQQAGSTRLLCSGSVVDASHILTAAHCVYDESGTLAQPSQLSVKAGVSNFSSPLPTDLEQDRAVTSLRVHPGYAWTGKPVPDDVAVLALASPLDLSGAAVQAIALPGANAAFPTGDPVGLAGFGRETPTVATSGPLSWMTGTVDPQGVCSSPAGDGLIANNATLLCASNPTSAVCNGDSGSGLVTTGSPRVLVGVTSAGAPGCDPGSRGVFTYVGAPEILSFVQGSDQPPTAPRQSASTPLDLTWNPPLVVGNRLSCSSSGWGAGVQLSYSFIDAANGQALQSGSRSTFVLPAADTGATLRCEVAATSDGGTTLEETRATTAVRKAPLPTIKPVSPVTAARGRDVSIHVSLVSPPGLLGKFGVCAVPPKVVGGGVCSSTQDGSGAGGTSEFVLTFRIKRTSPLVTTRVELDAVAGVSTAKAKVVLRVTAA